MKLSVTPHQLTQMLFSDKDQAVAILRDQEDAHPYIKAVADYLEKAPSPVAIEKIYDLMDTVLSDLATAACRIDGAQSDLNSAEDKVRDAIRGVENIIEKHLGVNNG